MPTIGYVYRKYLHAVRTDFNVSIDSVGEKEIKSIKTKKNDTVSASVCNSVAEYLVVAEQTLVRFQSRASFL